MALIGKMTRLREERESDIDLLRDLRNDLDTQGWSKTLPPSYTTPMYRKRFEEMEFTYDPMFARFIIEDRETGKAAGTISYANLEPRISAMIGIVVAVKWWGTGLALDANETLLKFLFEELGLRVVRLYTHSGNPGAVKSAQKLGFKTSVRQREAIFKAGNLYDNLTMDILREEYYERHPELVDHLPSVE